MRRDRIAGLLIAAALVLTAPGCGAFDALDGLGGIGRADRPDRTGPLGGWNTAGCAFARSPRHTVVAGNVRTPFPPPRLAAAMERIDSGGRERFPQRYSGIEIDQKRVRAVVYRVPSAGFDDFVRRSAEDSCIVVRDSAHAVAELTGWNDRIIADLHYWEGQGVRIVTVGSRHDGAGVEIGTPDIDQARRLLPARYGVAAPLVLVEEGPVTPLTRSRPSAPGSGG